MREYVLPAADAAVLHQIPGCEMIDLILPDLNGLLRGKRITRDALSKIYESGVCLPMSLIATDITGNTVEETGLGYAIGDEDRICRPVPGSLRSVPWQSKPMAQLLLSMEDANGGVFAANPREVLKQVLDRYSALGLTPVVAVELEFYLLDAQLTVEGRPQTSINPATGSRNRATQVYYMEDLNDYQTFTDRLADVCRGQAIPADTAVAEYAPGQFEINLKHRADALQACDDAIYLKRAIKAVAAQQKMLASFMAKPFVDQAGSGMHIHVSLLDGEGRNVFAGTPASPAAPMLHAIGGLQAASRMSQAHRYPFPRARGEDAAALRGTRFARSCGARGQRSAPPRAGYFFPRFFARMKSSIISAVFSSIAASSSGVTSRESACAMNVFA